MWVLLGVFMLLIFARIPSTMNRTLTFTLFTTWWNMHQLIVVRSDLSRSFEIRQKSTCFKVVHIQNITITSYSIGISQRLRSLDQWTYDRKGIEDTWNMYTSNKLTFSPPSPSQSPWPPLRARAWWRTLLPRSEGTSWQHPKLLQSLSDFSDHQHVCKSR